MKLRIGILGSRGIPNRYGGFEQFASRLAPGLVERGARVWVYASHKHPYREKQWKGVNLIHCYDPEYRFGAAGQFVYDLNCIRDSQSRNFDILLQLGYTSNSMWYRFLPEGPEVITNMDGLEWKRAKYPAPVRYFLKHAERWAVKSSDALVGDSREVCRYLREKYQVKPAFIAYGADIFYHPDKTSLQKYGLKSGNYYLLIARFQEDNHIKEVIQGVLGDGSDIPLLVVGDNSSAYGQKLKKLFAHPRIRFVGSIFDIEQLNNLRYFCKLYFHGHSAGGTNPSLLEAMAAQAPVCAHDNPFNRSVLASDAFYFNIADDISKLLNDGQSVENNKSNFIHHNIDKIRKKYNWKLVIDQYLCLFNRMLF